MSKVFIAADHAGFALKEALKPHIETLGFEVEDCGAFTLVPDDDYPDMVSVCAHKVGQTPESFGIVIGASGQGEAMVANRTRGVRAAVYYGAPAVSQTDASGHALSMLESLRQHNDANVLSLGARFLSGTEAQEAVTMFLTSAASTEERHVRRRAKIDS